MWDRVAFKRNGKLNFNKNYWPVVAVCLLLAIAIGGSGGFKWITDLSDYFKDNAAHYSHDTLAFFGLFGAVLAGLTVFSSLIGIAVSLLVCNPYEVGARRFLMENRLRDRANFSIVKHGFVSNFGNIVLTQFLRGLFTFLWSLLFIVPGIVRAYGYFAVPYILAENPNMDHTRALNLSREMTMGWKSEIFVTDLSFIPWILLSGITAGIVGVFYVNPYMDATKAEIYAFLREQALQKGIATIDELPGWGAPGGTL